MEHVRSLGAPSMDLTRQQQQQHRSLASACHGPLPFPRRPWMSETGVAAAAAASGNLGLKGVIAGTFAPSRSAEGTAESVLSLSLSFFSLSFSLARASERSPVTRRPLTPVWLPHVTRKRARELSPFFFFFFWSQCTPANRTITRGIARSRSRAILCVCM